MVFEVLLVLDQQNTEKNIAENGAGFARQTRIVVIFYS
jgi:hypothetical protein